MTFTVTVLAFVLSFIFSLGGVGSAVVLVPVLHWLGYPLNEAKPTALFVNTISLIAASYSNFKNKRLNLKMGLPIIIASVIMSPIGAYVSTLISQKVVLSIFTAFLFFSGNMMLFFKKSKYSDQYREDQPVFSLVLIGILAGFVSGLLGVGGGGIVSPLMIMLGFNPKKVAVVTAFVIPFSSLTGFIAYLTMGHFNALLVIPVGVAAYLGGYIGTHFMHLKLSPQTIKRFLAVVILIMGVKMLTKVF
ncbi:MAG: sulfite exporter TauE/SafE family protein [Clostridia bacterium]|nr:sulfite exporter TauE/SafE family protein [Clostridia bacterium]MDD4048703.1 sulfite exporter TauE/SafE family protein [Clostridia bacterium]